jgi:hypothetical protein
MSGLKLRIIATRMPSRLVSEPKYLASSATVNTGYIELREGDVLVLDLNIKA